MWASAATSERPEVLVRRTFAPGWTTVFVRRLGAIAALRAEQSQLLAVLHRPEDGEIRSQRFARTASER
jgi:hypothetical protein